MSMTLQNELKFAESGLNADIARLKQLESQRAAAASVGEDTSYFDSQIASVEEDIDLGTQDVLDLQRQIDDENFLVCIALPWKLTPQSGNQNQNSQLKVMLFSTSTDPRPCDKLINVSQS